MLIPFDSISEDSRIWIFPSSRKFYPQELTSIQKSLEDFLNNWKADTHPIEAAFTIKYDRFIIVAVDESQQSLDLESHDALSNLVQELEKTFSVILIDKINVCFKQGEYVQYKELKAFKKLIKNRGVSKNTIVFDNMINTKGMLKEDWEIYMSESWLSYLL